MGIVHPPAEKLAKKVAWTNAQWNVVELAKTHVRVHVPPPANTCAELQTLVQLFVNLHAQTLAEAVVLTKILAAFLTH